MHSVVVNRTQSSPERVQGFSVRVFAATADSHDREIVRPTDRRVCAARAQSETHCNRRKRIEKYDFFLDVPAISSFLSKIPLFRRNFFLHTLHNDRKRHTSTNIYILLKMPTISSLFFNLTDFFSILLGFRYISFSLPTMTEFCGIKSKIIKLK